MTTMYLITVVCGLALGALLLGLLLAAGVAVLVVLEALLPVEGAVDILCSRLALAIVLQTRHVTLVLLPSPGSCLLPSPASGPLLPPSLSCLLLSPASFPLLPPALSCPLLAFSPLTMQWLKLVTNILNRVASGKGNSLTP